MGLQEAKNSPDAHVVKLEYPAYAFLGIIMRKLLDLPGESSCSAGGIDQVSCSDFQRIGSLGI